MRQDPNLPGSFDPLAGASSGVSGPSATVSSVSGPSVSGPSVSGPSVFGPSVFGPVGAGAEPARPASPLELAIDDALLPAPGDPAGDAGAPLPAQQPPGPDLGVPDWQPAVGVAGSGDTAVAPRAGVDLESQLDRALDGADEGKRESALTVAGSRALPAFLVVVRGDLAGKTLPLLAESPWILGRSESSVLPMSSKAASLEHARIERDGERYRLIDLNSTNGTMLNGRALKRAVYLRSGDTIEIADTTLLFLTQDGEEASATVPIHAAGLVRRADTGADGSWQPSARIIARRPSGAPAESWGPAGTWDSGSAPAGGDSVNPAQILDTILNALAVLRRQWLKVLALSGFGGAIGLATLVVKPPPSEVEFEVGIRWRGSENPLEDQQSSQRGEESQRFYSAAVDSFGEPALVRSTFQSMHKPVPDDSSLREIGEELKLSPVRQGVYRGSMRTHDPAGTVQFLKHHIENYMQSEVQKTLRVSQSQIDFLSGQVDEKNAALLKTEQELRDFKHKHLLELPENAGQRLSSVSSLESRRDSLAAQVSRTQGELALAQQQLARESPLIEAKVADAAPYRAAATEAAQRLAEARARGLLPGHPEVQELERKLAMLQEKADQAARAKTTDLDRTSNPAYTALKDRVATLKVELGAAQQELGSIGGQLGEINRTVSVMPTVEAEHVRLTRTYETDKSLHARLIERLRQVQVQHDLDRATAEASYDMVTPPRSLGIQLRKALILRAGAGFALGLVLALLIALRSELKRYVRRSPELRAVLARHSSSSELRD